MKARVWLPARRTAAGLAATTAASVCVAGALASAGTSIAAAPVVPFAVFHLAIPATVTGRVLLRVRASGASYLPALSTERNVAIH